MDKRTFTLVMSYFAATWPDRAATETTLEAYWLALQHLDDDVFKQAAKRCLRECTFYPKPAEIISRAQEILEAAGALPVNAADAWEEVMSTIQRHGWQGASTAEFSNPDIRAVVREVGGARHIGLSDYDTLPFIRREFMQRYEQYRQRTIADTPQLMAQPIPLPGDGPPMLNDQVVRGDAATQDRDALRKVLDDAVH